VRCGPSIPVLLRKLPVRYTAPRETEKRGRLLTMIIQLAEGPLLTRYGEWRHIIYWDGLQQAIAMVYGDVANAEELPTRVHSSCVTSHVFLSVECDCREQMEIAMAYIHEKGRGAIIWLDHEGRANGMMAHIASQSLKREGLSQPDAYKQLGYPSDARSYRVASEILNELKVKSIVVITNNPAKVEALRKSGLPVVSGSQRALIKPDNIILEKQYRDKISEGHWINTLEGEQDKTD
jgi:GTP cyclohydrolase II